MDLPPNRLPPNKWKVAHFANIGVDEEFVQQLTLQMPELLMATMIPEPTREQVKEVIVTISIEGFMPAFEHLKRIRGSGTQQMPVLNRKQLYEDFARVLWHAYKDLLQTAVQVSGTNIGFLFQTDPNFEQGLVAFEKEHPWVPKGFGEFLRMQRKNWQNELADFRNHFLEL